MSYTVFFYQSWEMASDRYREKLLELIGKIGKDDRQGKTASKVSADQLFHHAKIVCPSSCSSVGQ